MDEQFNMKKLNSIIKRFKSKILKQILQVTLVLIIYKFNSNYLEGHILYFITETALLLSTALVCIYLILSIIETLIIFSIWVTLFFFGEEHARYHFGWYISRK